MEKLKFQLSEKNPPYIYTKQTMPNRNREVSKYENSYKRRASAIDKRTLRALNRTMEQKEKRNESLNQRRPLHSSEEDSSLSTLKEDPDVETDVDAKEKTQQEKPKSKAGLWTNPKVEVLAFTPEIYISFKCALQCCPVYSPLQTNC